MFSLILGLLAASSVFAAPRHEYSHSKRCVHDASDRACWGDFDLSTDYYDIDAVPDTGVVREYWFDIQNGTAAPDGVERVVLTVNGTFPGPTIIADWGDTIGEILYFWRPIPCFFWLEEAGYQCLRDNMLIVYIEYIVVHVSNSMVSRLTTHINRFPEHC